MKNLKKTIALIIVLGVVGIAKARVPTYSLADAIKKKLVKVEINGADKTQPNSTGHYGKCIQMELTNLTLQHFKIKLNNGQQLVPSDTSVQNMMVTEGHIFTFNPRKKRKEYINAMCIQKSDRSPNKSMDFTLGSMSNGHLLGIAQLIEKHKYYNGAAQKAVWCISDGQNIRTIHSTDSVMECTLQKFVSVATGQAMPKKHKTAEKPKLRPSTNTVTFEWGSNKTYKTTLVVLNMKNKPVKVILKDKMLPAGHHSYEVLLSTADLPKGYYKVVLYINNKPQMNRKVQLGR
jgi:hypothetical protein